MSDKKVETKKEYPGAGLEDVTFNTAATEGELLVNTASIRAVRKEVVEYVKAKLDDLVTDDAKEPTSKKVETNKEYPGAGLEDATFTTGATDGELSVNIASIRAVRKEVVENVKAKLDDLVMNDAKELTSNKVETKKEYPGAGLEDVTFNTAATEGELWVNTESIRAVQKEVVENVKAKLDDLVMNDAKEPTTKKVEINKEYPGAGLEDASFTTGATDGELLVNTASIRAVRKEVVENVKAKLDEVVAKDTKKKV